MEKILVVDDEKNYLVVLEALLTSEGYEVLTSESAIHALELLESFEIDLVITDMKMPKMGGMEFLDRIKRMDYGVPVIMMTAFGTVEKAVEAMKKGVFDYILKPFQNEQLKVTIQKALEMRSLLKQNRILHEAVNIKYSFSNIVGKSKPMLQIYDLVSKVADTKATVLITGESGTGKELIARAIHFNSKRKSQPFVSVNCSALTETLLESELFGHEKGSFTGATATKRGRFEVADKGTLFLDEVGEMSVRLQVKLLRVLQEMEFERVGGTASIKVDVRILAATNKDLKKEVEEGNFREDLFFRLNVVYVTLPPLRERSDDIPLLISHFVKKYAEENGKGEIKVTPGALKVLLSYEWPGNIRELENVVERAVILCSDNQITDNDLPEDIRNAGEPEFDIDRFVPINIKLSEALERIEERMIRRALKQTNNVQAHAAELLGIGKNLFQYKMKKYQIKSTNI